jgi:hypothetical protein
MTSAQEASRGAAGAVVVVVSSPVRTKRGRGLPSGQAARSAGANSAATIATLAPAPAKIAAARTAGPVGSTGTYAAPARRTPWMAVTASSPLGSHRPTRSPRPAPHRASRVATRSAPRSSSA